MTTSCHMERMSIGSSHPIRHVAQGGLIAGGFCVPSGRGIVGAAAIEKDVCCSGGQNHFQVFWDQEVLLFWGKLGSPLPLWHSLQYIYIYTFAQPVHEYSYMSNSPHCSKHVFTFHSPFVPRSCPRHFMLPSLILDTCSRPSAEGPSSRVTVTKAPKGTMRATTPLNHS